MYSHAFSAMNVKTNYGLSATVEPLNPLISLKPSSIAHKHHTFTPVLAYYSEWTILPVYCPASPAYKLACYYRPNKLSFTIITLADMDIEWFLNTLLYESFSIESIHLYVNCVGR